MSDKLQKSPARIFRRAVFQYPQTCAAVLFACLLGWPAWEMSSSASKASVATAGRDQLAGSIDSIAGAAIKKGGIASASIAIGKGPNIVLAKAYGLSDIEDSIPATADTIYRIGSVTKQFTAAAVLQLAELGKLALDDSIDMYLPDFPMNGRKITIRNLLNHTSGLKNYTELKDVSRFKRLDLTESEMVDLFKNEPPEFQTGTVWSYTNSGYFLAGIIVEKASGQSYSSYLRDHIFAPLDLACDYCDDRAIVKHRAHGYALEEGKLLNSLPISMNIPFSAGALCSTATALVKWMRALTAGKVISKESFKTMTTATTLSDGTSIPYGLGLVLSEMNGRRKIAHSGEIDGFRAQIAYYPDDDLITATLINTEGGQPNAIQLERAVSRKALGIPETVIKNLPVSPGDLARYTGVYELRGMRFGPPTYRVFDEGGKLNVEMFGQKVGLLSQGRDTFVADFDPEVRLVFQVKAGRATGLSIEQYDGVFKLERKQ